MASEMPEQDLDQLAKAVIQHAWLNSGENFAETIGSPRELNEYVLQTDTTSYNGNELEMIVTAQYSHTGFGGGSGFIVAHAVHRDDAFKLSSIFETFDGEKLYLVPIRLPLIPSS